MFPANGCRDALLLLCVPALILVLGCGLSLMPFAAERLIQGLAVWSALSLPLAVLTGHCMLSEE